MKSKNNGIRKAAILLISLGPDTSAQILKLLPEFMIEKVTYEIANIERVTPEEREEVIDDFIDTASANKYVIDGGIDYAKELLQKALGSQRAKEVMDVLEQMKQSEKPFSIARKADTRQLTNLLLNEHPQTIALIMCYMQPEKAATVLSQFPDELQTEIVERFGTISRTSPAVIKKIENASLIIISPGRQFCSRRLFIKLIIDFSSLKIVLIKVILSNTCRLLFSIFINLKNIIL